MLRKPNAAASQSATISSATPTICQIDGIVDGGGSIRQAELAHQIRKVNARRVRGQAEFNRNTMNRIALAEEIEHTALTVGQGVQSAVFAHLSGRRCGRACRGRQGAVMPFEQPARNVDLTRQKAFECDLDLRPRRGLRNVSDYAEVERVHYARSVLMH